MHSPGVASVTAPGNSLPSASLQSSPASAGAVSARSPHPSPSTSAVQSSGSSAEEPELCTADVDGDGWGDRALTAPAEAGEDCNDADGSEFPGAVTEATPGECMRDVDGDGWGDILAVAPYDRS